VFKWLLVTALVLSLLFCAWREFEAQRTLRRLHADIAAAEAEIKANKEIDAEVQAYVRQKDALQKRIDAINQIKQRQKGPAGAVAKVAAIDATDIESVAVVGHNELVINRR
jgi:hypothetical protein